LASVRTVFIALLFANLAYFAWAHWVDVPPPPPVNEAIAKLPRLKLAEELPPAPQPPPTQAEKTELNDSAACLSLGPFAGSDASVRAAAALRARGFAPRQRAEEGKISAGYWVYVSGMQGQAEADKALATLVRNGIKDALVMSEPPDSGRRLSLGVFGERARAEKLAQAVRQQTGLAAEVAERKLPGTNYWVDLAGPPGMTTARLEELFVEGVSSHIAVQPCPATVHPPPPSRAAAMSSGAAARGRAAADKTSAQAAGTPKLR
jgi:hypothetical protein